ncbi:hypothetical protein [Sphingomonas quercus]|uniref:Uncharacterized protein n=1 Tax=Sphingomonas quercus TaxID=2842451 RepID=A0ABS6BII2_9SPHN|nr:hypothetical protein [Sphingomonas quercus]MBU3077621.1 hypothetical protein [Sphingomonas quercus]
MPQDVPRAPALPVPPPPLTRGDLISAAGQAASAYAEGKPRSTADPLVARNFAVRLPFGCNGPSQAVDAGGQAEGLAAWTWGPDHGSIQLRMTPGDWLGSAMLAGAGALDKWEAVEGFWIPRPWLASETCPAVRADPLQTDAPPASPQTVGLAAVFEVGSSRLARRNGRAYEYTIRAKGDAPLMPPQDGFRMLLEGRIAAFPSGQAIECRATGPDQRPVCIIAVKLDRVTYEDESGTTLSEWRAG